MTFVKTCLLIGAMHLLPLFPQYILLFYYLLLYTVTLFTMLYVFTYYSLDGVLKNFFLPPLIIDAFDPPDHKYSFDFALGGLWNVQIQKNEK